MVTRVRWGPSMFLNPCRALSLHMSPWGTPGAVRGEFLRQGLGLHADQPGGPPFPSLQALGASAVRPRFGLGSVCRCTCDEGPGELICRDCCYLVRWPWAFRPLMFSEHLLGAGLLSGAGGTAGSTLQPPHAMLQHHSLNWPHSGLAPEASPWGRPRDPLYAAFPAPMPPPSVLV